MDHNKKEKIDLVPPPPVGPVDEDVGMSLPRNPLFHKEDKNCKDIKELLKYGVDLHLIAEVKDCAYNELMEFLEIKSIIIPQHLYDFKVPLEGASELPIPSIELPEIQLVAKKKLKLPSPVPEGTYPRKHSWKKDDFPEEKIGNLEYFCGDCKRGNTTYHCKCRRKCWKWCDDCGGYRSNHHTHFKKVSMKKRRRPWREQDFPTENKGGYFCHDCRVERQRRLCECGRDCWKWCVACGGYKSKHHFASECFHGDLEEMSYVEEGKPEVMVDAGGPTGEVIQQLVVEEETNATNTNPQNNYREQQPHQQAEQQPNVVFVPHHHHEDEVNVVGGGMETPPPLHHHHLSGLDDDSMIEPPAKKRKMH